MGLTVEDVHAIVKHVDKTGVGYILFEHFQQAFQPPQDLVELDGTEVEQDGEHIDDPTALQAPTGDAASGGVSASDVAAINFRILVIEPRPMKELYASSDEDNLTRVEEVPKDAMLNLQVRVRKVAGWQPVWHSRQSMSRKEASVWHAIPQSSILARNRVCVCVGHYAAAGHATASKPPSSLNAFPVNRACTPLLRAT
jgi:hypothetical protein